MRSLTLGFWLFRRCVAQPVAWLGLALAAGAPVLLERLAPLGTVTSEPHPTGELGYVASLGMAALILGTGTLQHPFCTLLPARTVLLAQGLALLLLATTSQLLALPLQAPSIGLLLATGQLVLLALLAARLPVPHAAQASLLVGFTWVLPAATTGPASRMRGVLDPAQHLTSESNFLQFGCAALALCLFITRTTLRPQP